MRSFFYTIVLILFTGCGHFLDDYSQDLVVPKTVSDLNEILLGNGYIPSWEVKYLRNGSIGWQLNILDDDVNTVIAYNAMKGSPEMDGTYYGYTSWQMEVGRNHSGNNLAADNANWDGLYQRINSMNIVLHELGNVSQNTEQDKLDALRVEAECHFLRAQFYFLLVNMYAKAYDPDNAASELGVPLKLTYYVEHDKEKETQFDRTSVAKVYEQIVKDLKDAAENLTGVEQPTVYRVNEAAARILLSRVYLYMGEWQLAADECDRVMKLGIHLSNLNDFDLTETIGVPGDKLRVTKAQYMNTSQSPEVLFTQGSNGCPYLMFDKTSIGRYAVSQELCDLYTKYPEVTDLRLTGFFSKSQVNGNYRFVRKTSDVLADMTTFDCFIIRSAEAYLNKAEAEAMLGGDAITPIKKLLENRFAGGQIPAIDGLSGKELVEFIRDERRRELCFESQRWFDLRRYAVCVKYPESKEIDHVSYLPATAANANGIPNGTYRLKRYEEERAYVLPIPGYEIVFNRGELVDNPEREDREAI